LPFDNQLVLCSVSGYYLRKNFFETTNSRYYIYYGDYGANLKENIDNNATYYLITDTYSSTYGPNHLTEIERYDAGVYARDLLAKYIEQGGFGSKPSDTIKYTAIHEIYAIGDALPDNGETGEVYYVKAKIQAVHSTEYGNVTLVDENGYTLYVYGMYEKNGTRYDSMSNPPQAGDTVVLCAPIKKYVKDGSITIELFKAALWSIE
jgi:hypothetical protein